MLDNKFSVETPELIELSLRPASIWSRTMAFVFDLLIRSIAYGILAVLLTTLLANYSQGFIFIVLFLIEWFYPVYFEVWHDGVTPGKKYYGLRVVCDDGTPVSLASSTIRNLLRVVDFLPVMYSAGIVCSLCNFQFKRIGDFAAGTMVINSQPRFEKPKLSAEVTTSRPAPEYLSLDDQNAIVAYAERSATLSSQRRKELASYLKPLLNSDNADVEKILLEIANGITGAA